jgi:ubiquinone/menaquinone biosynthesis C-methylase UbiE
MNKPTTSWGQVADWYDHHLSDDDTYHQQVILPNLMRRVVPSAEDNILDLACGSGFFAQAFAQAGAQVIGTDISPELIVLAKKHAGGNERLTFKVSSSSKLAIADKKVTKAVSVLAIQNIAEVKETFSEVARVLKPGGSFYLVLNHPAFRVPKASSWGWDEEVETQYRRVDRYLSESKAEIEMHPGKSSGEKTISFHRPLQYYFKLLASAGFAVTHLEEWISHRESQEGPRAEAENRSRKEIPLFLFLEAKLI